MYLLIWFGLAALAGVIAHKKGRSGVGCFVLSILSPPIGLIAALLVSPKVTGSAPPRKQFGLFIRLLPLWLAIVAMVIGRFFSNSFEYWNAAPWLVVAAIPMCIVTLALTEIASYINARRDKENDQAKPNEADTTSV